jgi:uncharacterized protein (TIGR03663 family)
VESPARELTVRKAARRQAPSGMPAPKMIRRHRPAAASELGASVRTPPPWMLAAASTVAVATALRSSFLSLKPLHNDEGVNGFFLLRLFRQGVYRYDPANYHGPALYYIAYAIGCAGEWLHGNGLSTFLLRLGPALFGVAAVVLVLKLRRDIGRAGSLAAAALLALSPGAVYFSRDFIHESQFVFFTAGTVFAFRRYQEEGRTSALWLAALCCGLLFASKETAAISLIVLLIAAGLTALYSGARSAGVGTSGSLRSRRPLGRTLVPWTVAILIFVAVNLALYSSFGTNPGGVADALRSLGFWTKTAAKDQRYPWYTYVAWMAKEDPVILALSVVGGLLSLRRKANRFTLFASLWGFGLLAAYSLVPYKTPWLMLNMLLPLALVSGAAVEWLCQAGRLGSTRRATATAAVAIALLLSGWQCLRLNFWRYDDPSHPYVYVQTRRGFLELPVTVDRLSARYHGHDSTIAVLTPDYWPVPWYLRDYTKAGYWAKIKPVDDDLVIVSGAQETLMGGLLRGYDRVGAFPSRPGVDLVLFAKRRHRP